MEKRKRLRAKRPAVRIVMVVALMAAGLGLAGCGEEMARMEQTQSRLLAMVEANADQIAVVATRIEQNQEALQVELEDLRGNIRQATAETAAVSRGQMKLHEAMQSSSEQLAGKMAAIEQCQHELQAGIENVQTNTRTAVAQVASQIGSDIAILADEQAKLHEAVQSSSGQLASKMAAIEKSCGRLAENQHELQAGIENVQNNTQTLVAQAASQIASDIAAVADEQAQLHETVQTQSQQLADDVAAIEQNQRQWQSRTEGLQENIQQVAATINALGEDLARLQETLQQNVQDLAGMMEVTGKDQLKFREKTQAGLQALDDSLSDLRTNQNRLQSQIEDVQNTTESMGRDVPEALVRLADELARLDVVERAEIMDVEPESSSPPSDSGGEQ